MKRGSQRGDQVVQVVATGRWREYCEEGRVEVDGGGGGRKGERVREQREKRREEGEREEVKKGEGN